MPGTQHGFYVWFNDGDHWQTFSLNLPDVQVSDIWVEASSIAIATHGRGFYVLDEIGPLRRVFGHQHDGRLPSVQAERRHTLGGSASVAYLRSPRKV